MAQVKATATHIAPQAAYRSCSGAFCVTDRADVQPIGRGLSLRQQTLIYAHTAIRSPGLSFNGLHPRNPCNYTDQYSFTDHGGMKG